MAENSKPTPRQRERLKEKLNEECSYKMDNELLDRIIDLGSVVNLKKGQTAIRKGEVDDNLYIIMEGVMRIWYMDGDKEVTYCFGGSASIAQSFHCSLGLPATENYEACCRVRLLKIKREDFNHLLESSHSFVMWNLYLSYEQMYHFEVKRTEINGTTAEKYEKFIRHRPEIIRDVPLKYIASYLGITPEYLSKLRNTRKRIK